MEEDQKRIIRDLKKETENLVLWYQEQGLTYEEIKKKILEVLRNFPEQDQP